MQQLFGHQSPITKTIKVRRTRHAGHRWRSRDELISCVLLWTPTYGRAKAGRPVRTYIQQLCEDTGCSPEDLPEAMNDRKKWRERVRDICVSGLTWWGYIYIYIYVCVCVCVCVRYKWFLNTFNRYDLKESELIFCPLLNGFNNFYLLLIICFHTI